MTAEERITEALADHERLEAAIEKALLDGTSTSVRFAAMTARFTFVALLEILRKANPDLADAAGKWVASALEDGDTASEIARQWKQDIASDKPLWLPECILEAL
jgi:hypothetical protein